MNQKSYTLNTIFKNLLLYFSIIALALAFTMTSSALSSGENSQLRPDCQTPLRCESQSHLEWVSCLSPGIESQLFTENLYKWPRCIAPEHQAISQSKEVSREI